MDKRAEREERDRRQRATLWAHTYSAEKLTEWLATAEANRGEVPGTRAWKVAEREAAGYRLALQIKAERTFATWEEAADAAGIERAR